MSTCLLACCGLDTPIVRDQPIEFLWGSGYDPVFTWGALALLALASLVAKWAVADLPWRRRGVRCPQCRYDLRGMIEHSGFPLLCAECGLEISSRQAMTRARISWRRIGMAAVMLAGAHVIASGPQVKRNGWISLVPSSLLVVQPMDLSAWIGAEMYAPNSSATSAPQAELSRRLDYNELASWQEWIFFQRVDRLHRVQSDLGIKRVRAGGLAAEVHDLTDLVGTPEDLDQLADLVVEMIDADYWILNGGPTNGIFGIAGHLVIVAPDTVQNEIGIFLEGVRAAMAADYTSPGRGELAGSPRTLTVKSECPPGLLDLLRLNQTISYDALRSAGPDFTDGVSAEELTTCDRGAFGMLDKLRRP